MPSTEITFSRRPLIELDKRTACQSRQADDVLIKTFHRPRFEINKPKLVGFLFINDVKVCHANSLSMKESPHGKRMTNLCKINSQFSLYFIIFRHLFCSIVTDRL